MSVVDFNSVSILDTKNHFNDYNNQIKEALEDLLREVDSMKNILNTPKSTKITAQVDSYLKEKIEMVNRNGSAYNNIFDAIIREYGQFMDKVKIMNGGKNE